MHLLQQWIISMLVSNVGVKGPYKFLGSDHFWWWSHGKDGRWLYTASYGIRTKWPSGRRTLLYLEQNNWNLQKQDTDLLFE